MPKRLNYALKLQQTSQSCTNCASSTNLWPGRSKALRRNALSLSLRSTDCNLCQAPKPQSTQFKLRSLSSSIWNSKRQTSRFRKLKCLSTKRPFSSDKSRWHSTIQIVSWLAFVNLSRKSAMIASRQDVRTNALRLRLSIWKSKSSFKRPGTPKFQRRLGTRNWDSKKRSYSCCKSGVKPSVNALSMRCTGNAPLRILLIRERSRSTQIPCRMSPRTTILN